jgi:hypothetical protein
MKFRGKCQGEWCYVTPDDATWLEFWESVDRKTVGLFSGVFDQSSPPQEIYEGDILEGYYHDRLVAVQFGEHSLYVAGILAPANGFHTNDDYAYHCTGLASETIEEARVIGNIYDHPHLLEEEGAITA